MSNTGRRRFIVAMGALGWISGPVTRAIAAVYALDSRAALIVVDVQNCFMPGGTLPVKHGDEIVPIINRLALSFQNVVVTQDWHHPQHVSFASQHPGNRAFDQIALPYGQQVLWPDHCVQGTQDAALHPELSLPNAQLIIRKGFRQSVDSYSAFVEADHKTVTGLGAYLKARQITTCYVVGLATDFCVAWTALDARRAGFSVFVVEDACRAIDLNGSLAKAWASKEAAGVRRILSAELERAGNH